jgi:tetratricopeptide (TPR) repeat protein
MTQAELAAGRFTKQYVSQIERGEVVPSGELLDWLARRLGVERVLLETGLGTPDLERLEHELEHGRQLLDDHRYADALAAFRSVGGSLPLGAPRPIRREAMRGETWALVRLGRVTDAAEVLVAARPRAEGVDGSLEEQAEIAYLTGVCCYTLSEVPAAHVEFARALQLLDEAEEPNDRLRLDVHQWRSRCYRRQRDWEAASEDVERALELCDAAADPRRAAEVSFQASLVSYRLGRWVLARRQAETARDLFESVGDAVTKARVLNNLANLDHLLGNGATAIDRLREAFAIFVEAGLRVEAGYVLGSLAEMRRERGELEEADATARQAIELLEDRLDHVQEVGMAQLVLARVELEQGALDRAEDMLVAVDESFERADSVSHQARSWMTRGELELLRRNDAEAARLYRRAATALQPDDLAPADL